MINQHKTKQLQNEGKYQLFMKWAKDNGAIISDAIQYPAAFGDQGFTGVVATQDIPANTVIMAIPNKLIISYHKVLDSDLKDVFAQYPQLFDDDVCDDAEFNCLALFIFWHKLQGDESFWYPYLNAVDQFTMFEWRSRDIHNIQDNSLIDEFIGLEREMEKSWYSLRQVMKLNSKYFGHIGEVNKETFYWSYEFVMTRCFGYSLPSTSLVALADMFNHCHQNATTYHLVHQSKELTKNTDQKYKLKQNSIDLRLFPSLQLQQNYDQIHIEQDDQQLYVDKNKELLTSQQDSDTPIRQQINEINFNTLQLWKEKQIWELDFETSSDSEDNDSDDDQNTKQDVDSFKQIHEKELIIYNQSKQSIKQKQAEQIAQVEQDEQEQEQVSKCYDLIANVLKQDDLQQISYNHQIKRKSINETDDENPTSKQQSDSDSDSDSGFEWFDEEDNDIYFSITTTTAIKANDQVYTFYGRRSNKFLLLWYGFAMYNNKYDSFHFRVICHLTIVMDEQQSNPID